MRKRMVEKYNKQSEFRKNFEILKEEIKIKVGELFEYYINIYMGFLVLFGFLLSSWFFVEIFNLNFKENLMWDQKELYLFVIYAITISHLHFSFTIRSNLGRWIKEGILNSYLTKPVSCLYMFSIKEIGKIGIFNFMFLTPIFFLISTLFLNYSFLSILILFFVGVINVIPFILIIYWFNSLAFFIIEIFEIKTKYISSINGFSEKYPILNLTNNFTTFIFFAMFSLLYIQVILSLFLKTITFQEVYIYFIFYWMLAIFAIVGMIINWKYGLKKYEAFG